MVEELEKVVLGLQLGIDELNVEWMEDKPSRGSRVWK